MGSFMISLSSIDPVYDYYQGVEGWLDSHPFVANFMLVASIVLGALISSVMITGESISTAIPSALLSGLIAIVGLALKAIFL
jgi:hypothetical protein